MKWLFLKINGCLTLFERFIHVNRLNLFYTIFYNFLTLPLCQAIKFPIYIYGYPAIKKWRGHVNLNGTVRKGMVKINVTEFWAPGLTTERLCINSCGSINYSEG